MNFMISKSTWLHLRLPFFFFLMPVFLFGVAISEPFDWWNFAWIFFILHFLIYPASNGYNSYYDKDEDSIGGLEKPPPVSKELWRVSIILDGIALLLGFLVNIWFVLAIFLYGLVSKAYSYDKIRLKSLPISSWLVIGYFQGFFTLAMTYQGITSAPLANIFEPKIFYAGILSSVMLLGSYPMTQVYQHEEDARRNDLTLSRLLGIKGTFIFTLLVFGIAGVGFFMYFWIFFSIFKAMAFVLALFPVVIYFSFWFFQVLKDEKKANFKATMNLNLISATCLNAFFGFLALVENYF